MPPVSKDLQTPIVLLGLGAVGCLLAFAFVGSTMRLSGDDYCQAAQMTEYPFWEVQWRSYVGSIPFGVNRYSVTAIASLAGLFPPQANGVLTGLALVLWWAGLSTVLDSAAGLGGVKMTRLERLGLSAFVVFLTAYQAPDVAESLYWRSSMLSYLAPLVALTYVFGISLRALRGDGPSRWTSWSVAGLAFFAGGFSETGATLQICALAIVAGLAITAAPSRARFRRRSAIVLLVALAGAIAAGVALAFAPPAVARWATMPARADLASFLALTARCPASFLLGSIRGNPLPTAVTLIVFASSALVLGAQGRASASQMPLALFMKGAAILGATYILIAATCAPSILAQGSYPGLRALLPARFVMVLALASVGWILGTGLHDHIFGNLSLNRIVLLFAVLSLLAGAIYGLRAGVLTLREYERFERWSNQWDDRDREIRRRKDQGIRDIEVKEIDHIIPNVAELSADPRSWYNACAARYYGVRSLRADPP